MKNLALGLAAALCSCTCALAGSGPITNAPFVMKTYSSNGALLSGSPHEVVGTATLSSGSFNVTLSGAAVFSSSSSYSCVASDQGGTAVAVGTQNTSGSVFKVFGTGSNTLAYACIGN